MAAGGFIIIGGAASALSGNDHYKSLPKTISSTGVPMFQNASQGVTSIFDSKITKSNAGAQIKDNTYKEINQNLSRLDSSIDTCNRVFQRTLQAT